MQPLQENTTLSVSQVTGQIQHTLEQSFSALWVKGEISNLTKHGSGHWYFTLKDKGAQLGSVMFRRENQGVRFEVNHGMEVTVHGRISVYPPHGKYQLIVDQMLPAGQGDLHLAFEALKKKLHQEGLFDPSTKQELPSYPKKIGIVTSPTGAAIQDMLNILHRRFPLTDLLMVPVRVQGDGSADEISRAIDTLNAESDCDVLIIGRGGGSLEDLWAFNEESVARAIFRSEIPVISAVGHETDTTISDYVADQRAPTPSAAAELVVPDQAEVMRRLNSVSDQTGQRLWERINSLETFLNGITQSYAFKRPQLLLEQQFQELDHKESWLQDRLVQRREQVTHDLDMAEQRLKAVNPLNILDQGYAVISGSDGKVTRSITAVNPEDKLTVRFRDGEADTRVEHIRKDTK